jgi:putative ABC transport system permease protein
MMFAIPLAWLQLVREKLRLLVAVAGVAFAVILIFMQLGFRKALFDSSTRLHESFAGEIFLISPQFDFVAQPKSFSRRRLLQALGFPGVEAVSPVYLGLTLWKNPENGACQGCRRTCTTAEGQLADRSAPAARCR